MGTRLANSSLAATPEAIRAAHEGFQDWLAVRASSPLFRLREASDIERRLRFIEPDLASAAKFVAFTLDGTGLAGSRYERALVVVNPNTTIETVSIPTAQLKGMQLHPALRDARTREQAKLDPGAGRISVPARTAVVWVRS
jgi:hypothetical protein